MKQVFRFDTGFMLEPRARLRKKIQFLQKNVSRRSNASIPLIT
jgi:hypothetical protein